MSFRDNPANFKPHHIDYPSNLTRAERTEWDEYVANETDLAWCGEDCEVCGKDWDQHYIAPESLASPLGDPRKPTVFCMTRPAGAR